MHRFLSSHDQNEGWDMENLCQSLTYHSCFINLRIWQYYQVDPTTGETEDDGVEDEYQLEDLEVVAADYMLKVGVSNFRNAWESMGDEDEYQLEDLEVVAADYMLKVGVSNFKNAWESMGDE